MNPRLKKEDKFNISVLTDRYRYRVINKTNGEFDLVSDYNDKVVTIYHK